jgi:DnaJ-class molecular chaperone
LGTLHINHAPHTTTRLSAAKSKGWYDLHGADALKRSSTEGGGGYSFDAQEGPKAVFARFFGTANPYEALSGGVGHWQQLLPCQAAVKCWLTMPRVCARQHPCSAVGAL